MTGEAHDTVTHVSSAPCSPGQRLTKVFDYYLNSGLLNSEQPSRGQTFKICHCARNKCLFCHNENHEITLQGQGDGVRAEYQPHYCQESKTKQKEPKSLYRRGQAGQGCASPMGSKHHAEGPKCHGQRKSIGKARVRWRDSHWYGAWLPSL